MIKKIVLTLLTLLITFLIITGLLFLVIDLFLADFASSLIPGWHTTIYPTKQLLILGALIILSLTGFSAVIYQLVNKIIKRIVHFKGRAKTNNPSNK